MKFAEPRPFSDPEAAVRKLIEIANAAEAVQDGRIYVERVNGPFLAAGGSPAEYRAGIERAIAKGWLWRHESGNSPTPAPSCSPDEMPNLMPTKVALHDSRSTAGAFWLGRLSGHRPRRKTNPEGWQVASGMISLAFD